MCNDFSTRTSRGGAIAILYPPLGNETPEANANTTSSCIRSQVLKPPTPIWTETLLFFTTTSSMQEPPIPRILLVRDTVSASRYVLVATRTNTACLYNNQDGDWSLRRFATLALFTIESPIVNYRRQLILDL